MQDRAAPPPGTPAAIILNDTRVDRHHGCSSVMQALEAGLASAGIHVAATVPAHSDWARDPGFQSALPKAQLLVVNGEGTLHHDRPAGLRLLQAARHARQHGLATALVNAGWEANGAEYAATVRDFDLVSARDSRSAAALRAIGVDCRVVPDLSLCTPPPAASMVRSGVAYTDSVDPSVTLVLDALRRRSNGLAASIHDVHPTRAALDWRFLRAAVGKREMVHPFRAITLLRARQAQWRSAVSGVTSFMRRLAEIEFLVSGRFHACTLAMVTRTPFIAFGSNTGKVQSLLEDAGLEAWRCAVWQTSSDVASARERGWSDQERVALDSYTFLARESAGSLFKQLASLSW
jgi:hypothetical protein